MAGAELDGNAREGNSLYVEQTNDYAFIRGNEFSHVGGRSAHQSGIFEQQYGPESGSLCVSFWFKLRQTPSTAASKSLVDVENIGGWNFEYNNSGVGFTTTHAEGEKKSFQIINLILMDSQINWL